MSGSDENSREQVYGKDFYISKIWRANQRWHLSSQNCPLPTPCYRYLRVKVFFVCFLFGFYFYFGKNYYFMRGNGLNILCMRILL